MQQTQFDSLRSRLLRL